MVGPLAGWAGKRSIVPRRMSSLLLLLLLLTLLPVLLVQGAIYRRWLQMRYQTEVRTTLEAAHSAAATFNEYIRDIARQEATAGAALPAWQPHDKQQADRFLTSAASTSRYVRALHWVDPQGRIINSSDPHAIGLEIGDRAYFQQALATKGRVISDAMESRLGNGTIFVIAHCMRNASGQPLGVVAASVDLPGLEEAAVKTERLRDGAVAILDRHSRLVRSYPADAPIWQQQSLQGNASAAAAFSGNEATGRVHLPDGKDWAVAYVPIDDLGWVAGAARSTSSVMAPVWREILLAAGTTLAAMAGSLVFASLINRRINHGVKGLRTYVGALVRGDLDHQADVGGIGEFRALADAVNQLAVWLKQSQTQTQQTLDRLNALNETLEQRVADRTAESQQRARQLRKLALELTQTEQRERHRLAQILHDHLQQLLVGAKLNLGMLRYQLPDPGLEQSLQQVDGLLQESISVSRSLAVELSPSILYDQGLVPALRWLANWARDKHGLVAEVKADDTASPDLEEVSVLLFNAVRELLFNIVKHAKTNHATVEVCRPRNDQIQIIVSDAGIGFDPARSRAESDSATGLGLFSIGERLELLGGRLNVQSAPGQGTRVTLLAPTGSGSEGTSLAASHGTLQSVLPQVEVPASSTNPSLVGSHRIRVLLADDHDIVRDGLTRLLQMQADIEVVGQASDGQAAVKQALQLQPDVVLMDVSMPVLNGLEATRRIISKLPATRVIGLSMHAEADTAAAMTAVGAVAYLAKSSPPKALVAAIRDCASAAAKAV